MKNLHVLGVQEMDAEAQIEIDGGTPFHVVAGLALGIFGAAAYLVDNWEHIEEGFSDAYNG